MSKALNIFGLLLNLPGVVLLFLFGMPFRIATASKASTTSHGARQSRWATWL